MIKGKVLVLRIALIIALSLACLLMTACLSREARAQRIINETAQLIPIFSEFYEEHEEFFDLLLDIQKRLRAHYYDTERTRSFRVQFFLRIDEKDGYRPFDMSESLPQNRPRYTFCNKELAIIEKAMRKLDDALRGETMNVMVRDDWVVVGTIVAQGQVRLDIASPVMHGFEFGGGRFYMYTRNLNSDWSFHIQTLVRR